MDKRFKKYQILSLNAHFELVVKDALGQNVKNMPPQVQTIPIIVRWEVPLWSDVELRALQKAIDTTVRLTVSFTPSAFIEQIADTVSRTIPEDRDFTVQAGVMLIERSIDNDRVAGK